MTTETSSFRTVLANSPVYSLGEIVQRGAGIIFFPLYTRYLETSEYGAAILATVIAGFAESIFSLHLRTALVRFTYDAPDDREYLGRLYGTIFKFNVLLSGVLLIVSIPLTQLVLGILGVSDFWLPYAYLMLVIAATSSFFQMLQRIAQANQNARLYITQQWLFFFIGSGTTIVLLVGFGVGGLSIVIGSAVASVSFFVYAWLYILRNYRLLLDRSLLRACLGYSLPLLPNGFAGLLPRVTDRVFLSSVSVGLAGVYSAGYRLGESLSYVIGGFFLAHLPWFYMNMGQGEPGRRRIVQVARRAILVVSSLGILFALFSEEGIRLTLGSDYHEAWKVVPLAVFAVVFNSLKDFWLKPLTYKKSSTRYVPIATYTFAGLSVGFTAWMVPAFGIMGAAGAILAARFLSSFVMLYFSVREENVGYPVGEMYVIALAAFFLSLIVYLPVPGLLSIKLVVAVAVIGFVLVVGREEWRQAVSMFRKRSSSVMS